MTLLPNSSSAAISAVGASGLPRSTKRATSGKPAQLRAGRPQRWPEDGDVEGAHAQRHAAPRPAGGERLRQRRQRERPNICASSAPRVGQQHDSRSLAGVSEANSVAVARTRVNGQAQRLVHRRQIGEVVAAGLRR